MKHETEMTEIERCNRVIKGINEGLAAVFGDKCSAEIENDSIIIDGWICLAPVLALPKPRTFTDTSGKAHNVSFSGTKEHALWEISTLRHVPGDRETPPDVDINDIDTLHMSDAMHLAITLVANNIYNQFCEYRSEQEMDKAREEAGRQKQLEINNMKSYLKYTFIIWFFLMIFAVALRIAIFKKFDFDDYCYCAIVCWIFATPYGYIWSCMLKW